MIFGAEPITSADFNKGLVTRSDFLKGDINASPNTMDVTWNFDASLHKRFGCSSTNTISIGSVATAGFSLDSAGTLVTGLTAWWKFDESSGTRYDQFTISNLLDTNSNTNSIVGIVNQAANLISANSCCFNVGNVGNVVLNPNNTPFSISTWFYLTTTGQQTLVSKRLGTFDTGISTMLHFSGGAGSTTIIDDSYYKNVITANSGARISTTQSKFNNSSCVFDTTGNYIGISQTNINTFNFVNGVWTSDFWLFMNNFDNYILWTQGATTANYVYFSLNSNGSLTFLVQGGNTGQSFSTSALAVNTGSFQHISILENGNTYTIRVGGITQATTSWPVRSINFNTELILGGAGITGGKSFNGYIDEFHTATNRATWSSDFSVPTGEYSNDYNPSNTGVYQYWFYINSDSLVTFRVSSSGYTQDGTVQCSSFGTVNTATWYNAVAFYQTGANANIGLSVNLSTTTAAYTSGIPSRSLNFAMGAINDNTNTQPTLLNGRLDETGFWGKVLTANERADIYGGGTGNTYTQAGNSGFSWASFDFGASSLRWLTISAGTGIYASSNLGTTFVVIGTTRTQNYQSITRSKNVAIFTSDSYDASLYWAGSAGTFSNTLAPNSAPAAKFSINYQGFLILLNFMNSNNVIRNRGFAYADENFQLTDPWTNSFDIPSSADDEITSSFILYKFLYISTRYTIYRVSFVGGNPDWSYLKVKDWGFVPRTVQIVSLKGGGQVAIGMDWNRRIRAFDGFDDMFVSDNIENDNGICDFAMNKVSYAGSGLVISNAVLNTITQEYRLNIAIGQTSTQTTHGILLNARNLAFYPYSNQNWQTMCMAQSNNQNHLMAADRSGFVYILDSGNLDSAVKINDIYDSPPLFSKLPELVSKGKQLNLFFAPKSSGTVYYQERYNLSNIWSEMKRLTDRNGVSEMMGTESQIKLTRVVDVKATYNTYQFRLTSSANTAIPWQMDRLDYLQQGFGIGQG